MLTIREKLTHFTHIHRSVPRLIPAAFRHDSLYLRADQAAVPAHLQSLLSSVSSLSYDWNYGHPWDTHDNDPPMDGTAFCRLAAPPSPSAPSPLVNLRHLALQMFISNDDLFEDADVDAEAGKQLAAVFPSPNAFPHLTSLQLNGHHAMSVWFSSVFDRLPALSEVVLVNWRLDVADLVTLLEHESLTNIRVDGHIVHWAHVDDCMCQEELMLTPPWLTLQLPLEEEMHRCDGPRQHSAIIPALLHNLAAQSCSSTETRRVTRPAPVQPSDEKEASSRCTCYGLERLNISCDDGLSDEHIDAVRSIASMHSLTAVDLPGLLDPRALLEFATAASPSTLPHLRVLRCAPDEDTRVLGEVALRCVSAVLDCIRRFVLQLEVLRLEMISDATAAQALTIALQCRHLKRLEFAPKRICSDSRLVLWPSAGPFPLLHLHSLEMDSINIGNELLVRLVHSCPGLEDVQLHLADASLTLLCAFSRHRYLRRLHLHSKSDTLFDDPAVVTALRELAVAMDGEQLLQPFSSLRFLRVDWGWASTPACMSKRTEPVVELLSLLPAVLRYAPLSHVHLALPYSPSELHLFAAFSQLRRLAVVGDKWVQTTWGAGVHLMAKVFPHKGALEPFRWVQSEELTLS